MLNFCDNDRAQFLECHGQLEEKKFNSALNVLHSNDTVDISAPWAEIQSRIASLQYFCVLFMT